MAVRPSCVDDYGIILNGIVDDDTLERWADAGDVEWTYADWVEAFELSDGGHVRWGKSDYYDNMTVYWVSVKSYPGLFSHPYQDMDELLDELTDSVRGLDPSLLDRIDVRRSLRRITGAWTG